MKIAIGSDHAGFELKEILKNYLKGHECKDFGTYTNDSVDYPDYAEMVGESVSKGEYERGILICGSGTGMSISANKIPGIRAAPCYTIKQAELSREHNNANILCLGSKMTDEETVKKIVDVWLNTEFAGDRHSRRVNKISDIEKKYSK